MSEEPRRIGINKWHEPDGIREVRSMIYTGYFTKELAKEIIRDLVEEIERRQREDNPPDCGCGLGLGCGALPL